jgi:hypothetical protein
MVAFDMKKNPAITVFHLITAPTHTDDEAFRGATVWTQDYVDRGRHYFAATGTELLRAHPLFSRIVGFGYAVLLLRRQEFSLQRVRVSVGDERQCLRLARAAHAETQNFLMYYSPWGWMAKYLMARSTAVNAGDGAPAPIFGRTIDLADMLSLGGLVGAPPLHLALAAQGIANLPTPLPAIAIEKLLVDRMHEPLCRELVLTLWGVSALYVRMHFGFGYSIRPLDIPLDGGDAADA